MNNKIIAALLVFVMVFSFAAPVMAYYRTGSAVGDGVLYGATEPNKDLKKDI